MTVLEVIQKSTAFLDQKGVDSPRLQVELLLADLLGLPRLKLYLEFERELSPDEVAGMRERVRQRGQRIPLQHLLGSTSFCGHEVAVNPDVLIPRPETEQLAERAIAFLKATVPAAGPPRALDFGTGSGCLAIALALACPGLEVDAVDLSAAALATARRNVRQHHLEARVYLLEGDGFAPLPAGVRYQVIVANPPYIPSGEIASLQPEVRDHDPRLALDGGPDGLTFYRRLAAEGGAYVAEGGRLMVELGYGQGEAVSGLFQEAGWQVEEVFPDEGGIPRIIVACPAGP